MTNEIGTMEAIAKALDALEDEAARTRVLTWATSKYATSIRSVRQVPSNNETPAGEFTDFPSLFDTASPKSEPEKALIAAYWHQTSQGQSDLDSQTLNTSLKNMGHGIANITDALTSLIRQKPALVLQVRKGGKTRQARKKYRVTSAGVKAVQRMLAGSPLGDEEG